MSISMAAVSNQAQISDIDVMRVSEGSGIGREEMYVTSGKAESHTNYIFF